MTPFPSFPEFYRSVTGNQPFAWQTALAEQVRTSGQWPGSIDVPTGLGKTSCIHIAVYELARQLHTGGIRTAPLRIHHVIDRNTVVAQSSDDVRTLAARINAPTDGHLHVVKDALAKALPPHEPGRAVSVARYSGTLRVGDPRRAFGCVITSMSAHQFMSRILFRGFGVGSKIRSIDAGLAGVDSLVFFDEPHLSEPSLTALSDIVDLQSASTGLDIPGLCVVMVGATRRPALTPGTVHQGRSAFGFVRDERADVRINAQRVISLSEVSGKSEAAFAKRLASHVRDLRAADPESSIGVVVNTVSMAQHVARLVREAGVGVSVVTSRVRPLDRSQSDAIGAPGSTTVATQCIEVGMDVSFDHLVTEACPMPSFVQRLGRLNRYGSTTVAGTGFLVLGTAKGVDVVRDGSAAVYGEAPILTTVAHLREVSRDGVVDASVRSQHTWRNSEEFWPEAERHATLTTAAIPYLTMTHPVPFSDLSIDAFISGPDSKPTADVQVAWRADLDDRLLADCPPVHGETVSLPIGEARRFLGGHRTRADALSDAGAGMLDEQGRLEPSRPQYRVRVQGSGWVAGSPLSAGCTVVVDAAAGGYSTDGWDPPSRRPVSDLSAVAALSEIRGQRTTMFPLSDETLAALADEGWVGTGFGAEFEAQRGESDVLDPEDRAGLCRLLNDELDRFDPSSQRARVTEIIEADNGTLVALITGSTTRGTTDRAQFLDEHSEQVSSWAAADAIAVGLSAPLVDQIAAAGHGHDQGKAAIEWQRLANRGQVPERPLAKFSVHVPKGRWRRYALSVGFPQGWRHEALSYFLSVLRGDTTLTSHLIASHHGWFRPFVALVREVPDVPLSDDARRAHQYGSDYADTFNDLNRRFGPWGLAYLEAVLRLSDWRASEFPAAPGHSPPVREAAVSDLVGLPTIAAGTDVRRDEIELTGLTSSPTSGWFAAVGLLGFAESRGVEAAVHWKAISGEDPRPALPVLRLGCDLGELVDAMWRSSALTEADRLARRVLDQGLFVKSHKIGKVDRVRRLLKTADSRELSTDGGARLITGVVNDTVRAADRLELAIAAIANNSSFGPITAQALAQSSSAGVAVLLDPSAGFVEENFDGGFDRPAAIQPQVNGIGEHGKRESRGVLTPFMLHGFAALGMPPPGGYGVSRRTLTLPLPGRATTLASLRALTLLGDQSSDTWDWASIDCDWILQGALEQPTKYEKTWKAEFVRRSLVSTPRLAGRAQEG